MSEELDPGQFLASCTVDESIFELRPDYRALLVVADNVPTGSGTEVADALVAKAEAHAQTLLEHADAAELPHIAAWREAYRAFGAKPQRTRNSLEALTRRAEAGMPRVNALTDIYNAISVLHQIPFGGEDLTNYEGPARLTHANGDEHFETTASGEPVTEHPEPGEVIWRDDAGVTCRRWNWRQGTRTALTANSGTVLFILDALAPVRDEELQAAQDALVDGLSLLGSEVRTHSRIIRSV